MNLLIFPTLALSICTFVAGAWLYSKAATRARRTIVIAMTFVCAAPGALIAAYYTHLFDNSRWFYEFRSFKYSELSAAGAGLFAGALSRVFPNKIVPATLLFPLLVLGISSPYLKPIIAPASFSGFNDKWTDGVCRQSADYSCGPACVATLLIAHGHTASEVELARECYTYAGGTENWHMARALRRRGFAVRFLTNPQLPDPLPTPSIAGVRIGNVGHFIALMEASSGIYVVGDPLRGRSIHSARDITRDYDFTGFFLVIKAKGKAAATP